MQNIPETYGEIPHVPERMTLVITVEVNRSVFHASIPQAVADALRIGCMNPVLVAEAEARGNVEVAP